MKIRVRYLALALFMLSGIVAVLAVTHMNSLPAFVVIGPGYVVQAWLFESDRALGGAGYYLTMVVVSAIIWTLVSLSLVVALRALRRLVRRRRAA